MYKSTLKHKPINKCPHFSEQKTKRTLLCLRNIQAKRNSEVIVERLRSRGNTIYRSYLEILIQSNFRYARIDSSEIESVQFRSNVVILETSFGINLLIISVLKKGLKNVSADDRLIIPAPRLCDVSVSLSPGFFSLVLYIIFMKWLGTKLCMADIKIFLVFLTGQNYYIYFLSPFIFFFFFITEYMRGDSFVLVDLQSQ